MYKKLLLSALALILIVGCGPKSQTATDNYEDSAPPQAVESPDPGRPAEANLNFAIEVPPEPIHQAAPKYPPQAQDNGIAGSVVVKAYIDEHGKVQRAKAMNCSRPGFGFEEAALKAAYKYRYRPARHKGEPIGVWITYKVNFVLN